MSETVMLRSRLRSLVMNVRLAYRSVRRRLLPTLMTLVLRPKAPGELVRIGSEYGGWWIPGSVARPGAVAYCAGAGEDITFDSALVALGVRVTTFDPTPRSIAHVETNAPTSDLFRFVPTGWWDERTTLRFYAPADPAHVSHSVTNLQRTTTFFEADVASVHQLQAELGDDQVDIIKMDIEGAEYAVINSLLENGPRPRVLCVEFDQPTPIRRTIRAARQLHAAGYELAKIDVWNYTFIRQ